MHRENGEGSPLNREDSLAYARELAESGDHDAGIKVAEQWLTKDPDDIDALRLTCFSLWKKGRGAIAYQFAKRLADLDPKNASTWLNLGAIADELYRTQEAGTAFARAFKYAVDERTKVLVLNNICAMLVNSGKFEEAEFYGKKALEISPDNGKARANLGFCQLARKQWTPGWENYHRAIGETWRPKVQYGDEPEWNGAAGQRVVLYGEQGIGDEICFASMVPDALNVCAKVVIDCNPKLERLFARSFPNAVVYGTRNILEDKPWDAEDREIDASLPIGQLGELFRLKDESFDAKPFLVADPIRVMMWKALWQTKRKPVIGIAWSGGIPRTGAKFRVCPLEDWLPLFEKVDAHYVCLQYKPADVEIADFREKCQWVDLVEYPYATLTDDYDDTAALVASLDCVVSVPTAVVHLAGAVGTPNVMMKAKYGCWKTAAGIPFHPVTQFVDWQGSWRDSITASLTHVEAICEFSSGTIPDNLSQPTLPAHRLNGTHQSQSASPA